ncbi:MAG TPA: MASE4 domain-containing protein [Xanthobacteraceae bacterium]|nr:MASE4 domain-containing protein [Xanthobacteraceae bacterium]
MSAVTDDTERGFLSTAPVRPADRRLAFAVIAVSALIFACAAPFAGAPLPKVPAFIPSYEAALAINDLITAVLLFEQFAKLRSSAVCALASGYLFTALMAVAHALTFPDLFAPGGLFDAGPDSTAWLYVFWHGGFPLAVIAYALGKDRDAASIRHVGSVRTMFLVALAAVVAAVVGLTALATAGKAMLPAIMAGNHNTLALTIAVGSVWTLSLAALAVLVWRRPYSILDLWLMVVMSAWLFDVALSSILNGGRFDLGFYAGRVYGLLAASFVLAALLLETGWLHDRLTAARAQLADRARDLERRVRERTEELQRSNAALKAEIAERQQAEQELQRTRAFLDVMIESLPAMLLVKDAGTGRCIYLNRAGEDLLGIDRAELVGKTVRDLAQGQDADLIELQDKRTLTSDKPYEIYEGTLNTRKLGKRLVRTKKLPVPDETGAPKYLLAFSEDITDQRQLEDQLRHSQKMEALGHLTGGLAHDFNNLLAIIIGNLDVLAELRPGDAEQTELVQGAISAALSGSELTKRLLAFARRQPLLPEQVDLNMLVEEISMLLKRTLGQDIAVDLDLDRSIPPVTVDRVQLETAIANLANNARDAMPNGGRLLIATHTAHLDADYAAHHAEVVPGSYVAIEVSDSGQGMTPEVAARIFEPFYTTKAPGKGTGLGLSMVFGFMKQSGGHINVYSEPGRGTTFRLYLRPASTVGVAEDVEAPPLQPEAEAHETILVVEDNSQLRQIVVKQLIGLGFEVFEVDNAKRALELLALKGKVDLLFTDVVLPGEMDGCALAREVVARCPDSKVLLTSGFPGARLTDMQTLGTSVRLLSKPYRKEDLARTVREVLKD